MSTYVALNNLDSVPPRSNHTVVVSDVEEDLFGRITQRLAHHSAIRGLASAERREFFSGLRPIVAFYIGTRKAVREPARQVSGRRASVEIPALIVDLAKLLGLIRHRTPRIWITPGTGKECAALQIAREVIAAADNKHGSYHGNLQRQAANAQVMLKNWAKEIWNRPIRSGVAGQRVWHSIGVYLKPRNTKWIARFYLLYLAKHSSASQMYWLWWGLNGPPSMV